MKKILLISGGFDSLLIAEQKHGMIDEYVYFDYGQKFIKRELEVIEKWEKFFGINVQIIKMDKLKEKDGMFFGRNLLFFLMIRELYMYENICVYFGNNAEDNYSDNTRAYLFQLEKMINDSYPMMAMRIICPLENMNKKEIYLEYTLSDSYDGGIIPYFCDSGDEVPCKKCHSCIVMLDLIK
jgi:7-cyano-7-deazaguanine synthase in queuosine biosynthesis